MKKILWIVLAIMLGTPQTTKAQQDMNQTARQQELAALAATEAAGNTKANNDDADTTMLRVNRISVDGAVKAEDVPSLMAANGVAWHSLDNAPWEDRFPYRPKVQVAIAHTGKEILLAWDVDEQCVRAEATADGGAVWQDSCCELFFQPEGSDNYYNIECNCGGKLLVQGGIVGTERPVASAELMAKVKRCSSLGSEPFPLTDEPRHWQLCEVIPVEAFFLDDITDLSGMQARGNLYKCGDYLSQPHYLAMFPIHLPEKPAFHCPEFFQTLSME